MSRRHLSLLSTLETMERSLPTSAPALSRLKSSLSIEDPLDLVRKVVQKELNQKIHSLFQEYIRYYFQPAAKNVEANLGLDTSDLLERTCINALEHAKVLFRGKGSSLKRPHSPHHPGEHLPSPPIKKKKTILPKFNSNSTNLFTINRKGPQWSADRISSETVFVLGSKANKALGYQTTLGKLYSQHPDVFKYPADNQDKEWLAKELIMSTTGGKAFIMVLEDIFELSNLPVYCPSTRIRTSELTGFKIPEFMMEKIKISMKKMTNEPSLEDKTLSSLLHRGSEEVWDPVKEGPKVEENNVGVSRGGGEVELVASSDVHDILNGIKDGGTGNTSGVGVEDDLGFLHGMNLTSLVREFEMEAGTGSQHLGILSLADDTESFSELSNEVQENIESSFDNIEFN
ncbi:DNTTIP1 [Lepeophtheirus salmonis]|uniref:DNTTIP1 n=3 Tax=Lepeophtheirus salmonis TaxID=72036 RepID=A0A0K2TKF7_LEPSM|nr:DNTTIP1 [Lepeophtheirus salmonis]CAF3022739.1 DNTTIP1 [Lepeophtheirus salmonis]